MGKFIKTYVELYDSSGRKKQLLGKDLAGIKDCAWNEMVPIIVDV